MNQLASNNLKKLIDKLNSLTESFFTLLEIEINLPHSLPKAISDESYLYWTEDNNYPATNIKMIYNDDIVNFNIYFNNQVENTNIHFTKTTNLENEITTHTLSSTLELPVTDYYQLLNYFICHYKPYDLNITCK